MEINEGHAAGESSEPIARYFAYPFASDDAFQHGLLGILSNAGLTNTQSAERDSVELSSRVFYFNRITGLNVTVDEVRSHSFAEDGSQSGAVDISRSIQPTIQDDGEPEHRILSFAELKTLIEQGKTDGIPHNRVIPDEINKEKPSESKAAIRRKPWETASQDTVTNEPK